MTDFLYNAEIKHDEKTIENLYRTQYYLYEKKKIIIRFSIGILLIVAAVSMSLPIWGRALLLLVGTWIVSSPDFPAQVRTDKVIQVRKGIFPHISYEFYDDKVKIYDKNSADIAYSDFTKILYDEKYLYLFISKNSVCMIDIASISEYDNFIKFIEGKTGLKFIFLQSIPHLLQHELRNIFHQRFIS